MPTVIDETVASAAYDTSGNGGRKVVKSNNDIIMVVKNGTTEIRLYKKSGTTAPVLLANFAVTTLTDVCIENTGNGYVGILYSHSGTTVSYRTVSVSLGTLGTIVNVDSGQSSVGNVTMIANETRTEMSMAVATKNATYANSWNIRSSIKGTINADGTVTFGTVEQVTLINNTGEDIKNPSMTLNPQGNPIISAELVGTNNHTNTTRAIIVLGKSMVQNASSPLMSMFRNSNWSSNYIYNAGGSYTQSSPSAILVPQSINGLANGRIWVAWHGTDATDTTANNLRVSYSDDGGVTWSAMTKLTNGNTLSHAFASMTANKNNEVFIIWHGAEGSSTTSDVRSIKHSNGSWGIGAKVTNIAINAYTYPSALFDLSVNFTSPLFIYKASAKVGFYGTWTVTTISVQQGSLGTKSDKSNLLTYTITTDGTMSTITEKVNGAVTGTKTATSGQSLIAGLSQSQWDAIKYGKYADVTGGANTLTVEMGSEKWTYTFDKRLATDADILSAVKATQDAQTTYLPAVKSKLASAVRGKGGTVNDTDSWEQMVSAVGGITIPKKASGTGVSPSGYNNIFVTVTGLTFKPSYIIVQNMSGFNGTYLTIYTKDYPTFHYFMDSSSGALSIQSLDSAHGTTTPTVTATGFTLRVSSSSATYRWTAFE
jgi:hypothetical protein